MANLQLLAGGDVGALEDEVAALAVAGARRNLAAELPQEAESLREAIRRRGRAGGGDAGGDPSSATRWSRPA